jgi:DNA-binding NtrC family response regulator
MKKYKILIVDDELSVRTSLGGWFMEDGFEVETAASGEEALNKMPSGPFDIILLDIKMPGIDGITLQKRIKEIDDTSIVIIMTAYASVDTAVEALKHGAFDYVSKPFDPDDLSHLVRNALKQKDLTDENLQLRETISGLSEVEEIVGDSEQMKKIFQLVNAASEIDSAVLIKGESGTGKEYIARAIHSRSMRRYSPFVAFNNSGAIPESLLESELFGHEKGAIKHAQYRRRGKIELANGGTLFLSEIEDLRPNMQLDLLRVLKNEKIMRMGGREEIHVNFRLISSTKANLESLVEAEKFRQDLYYQINVFSIFVPPLRERKEDILPLARHFIAKYSRSLGIPEKTLSKKAEKLLQEYHWPRNVRELENAIERALVIGDKELIEIENLPIRHEPIAEDLPKSYLTLAEVEKKQIETVLKDVEGNLDKAAEILGIAPDALRTKLEKIGILN